MNTPQPEPPRTRRAALKVVKTQDLIRDDWLTVRHTGVGSFDTAAVGLNLYM